MGDDTGGILVATDGQAGSLVSQPGQLQYGDTLMGVGTPAGWLELAGWRDLPEADPADADRPQSHGTYPGDVFGTSLVVTYTYLLRGLPAAKLAALNAIERATVMDGVDRPLVVDDGSGPWLRMARVVGRDVPQDKAFTYGPLTCSVTFLCADPRRYALTVQSGSVRLPVSVGGLAYPLTYPLDYGTAASGSLSVTNGGTLATPLVATFVGPLTDPVLTCGSWRLAFGINLADGETLTVDSSAGTALLNDTADRLYTITATSDPLERAMLPPGDSDLMLTAGAGSGSVAVTFRDARM